MVGVEWGSGRSTKWFAGKIRHLTSIEDNADWHAIVTKQLADAGTQTSTTFIARSIGQRSQPTVNMFARAPQSLMNHLDLPWWMESFGTNAL